MIKNILRNYWPSALVCSVILYSTLASEPALADDLPKIPHLDKLIHAIMFGGFAGALCFDYSRCHACRKVNAKTMFIFSLVAIAFGGLIELLQNAMQIGRSGDWLDFIADTVGVIIAFFTAPIAVAAVLKKKAEHK